jgi:hypothetical protein
MNPQMVLVLSAVGAAIENMRIFARAELACDLQVEYEQQATSSPNAFKVARFRRGRRTTSTSWKELSNAVFERSSYRGHFNGAPLTPSDLELWATCRQQLAKDYPDVEILLLDKARDKEAIAQMLAVATPMMIEVPAYRRHVFVRQMRFADPGSPPPPDGMPLTTLGDPPPAEAIIRALGNPVIARMVSALGISKLMGKEDAEGARAASAFGLFLAKDSTPKAIIEAGASWQRMWLALWATGLKVQASSGAMVASWAWRFRSLGHYRRSQVANVETIAAQFAGLHPQSPEAVPVMLFRFGRGEPFLPRTGRRQVSENLLWSLS